MTEFTLNLIGVEEAVNDKKPTFEVGVHECIILDVAMDKAENDKGTEFIKITVSNDDKTRINEEKFYLSSGAVDGTRARIKHLVKAIHGEDAAEKAYSLAELKKILVNQKVRLNFTGEEFRSQNDGNIYIRTQLAYRGFAENINTPIEKSILRVKNVKKLKEDVPEPAMTSTLNTEATKLEF